MTILHKRFNASICLIGFTLFSLLVSGQEEVPDLTADIPAITDFLTIENIEANFNHARRQEEIQLNLPANIMPDLVLPAPDIWNNFTDEQKVLFIINDERMARNGIDYNAFGKNGLLIPVDVCIFQGMLMRIQEIAGSHATYLEENDIFGHIDENGNDAFERVEGDPVITGNIEQLKFIESLALFASTNEGDLAEAAVLLLFALVYEDEQSFFKHRQMLLLSKFDFDGEANNPHGLFTDNHDLDRSEGYLGIGIARGPFMEFPFGMVMVIDMIDLTPEADLEVALDSDLINRKNCFEDVNINGPVSTNTDGVIAASGKIGSDATIETGTDFSFNAGMEVGLEEGFEVVTGGVFTISIENCMD